MSADTLPFPAPASGELLTVAEFAERLKVSRTTVFSWLKGGELREGVHYLRLGRILRFLWPFFPTPLTLPGAAPEKRNQPRQVKPARKRPTGCKPDAGPPVNLDY